MRCEWDKIWTMSALEFLNVLAYRKDRDAAEAEAIRQFELTH